MTLRRRLLTATAVLCTGLPAIATAQPAYPTKPVTIIVPFAPGGGVDIVARLLAEKLRGLLGQNVTVENRSGGSGMIGAIAAVKAPADGHTLLMASAGEIAINPHVFKAKMQYVPERDLAPISLVVKVPNVLVVDPSLPVRSVAELIAHAKANPGKVSYGSSGVGNPQHLAGELLEKLSGVPFTHVPYRGASNQLADTAGGTIAMTFTSLAGARAFIKDGRVRAIAMTSARRTPLAPDLPAMSETKGLEGYVLENWFGLYAPAATPQPVLDRIGAAVQQALKDPELASRYADLGSELAPLAGPQFRAFIQDESRRFAKLVQDANVTPDN